MVRLTRASITSTRSRSPHQGARADTSAASLRAREPSRASATWADMASSTSRGVLVPRGAVDGRGLEQVLQHPGRLAVEQHVRGSDVGEGGLELVRRLDPREGAPRGEVRVARDGREAVGRLAGQQDDVGAGEVGQRAGALGPEEPRLALLPRQSQHRRGRCAGAGVGDPGQQVGLALAPLEPHPPQAFPRAVVALEELGVGQGGTPQQRQPALVVDDDEAHLDLVEEPTHLRSVEVLGEQQRHRPGDPGGELELELAGTGRDPDDDDLTGVDPGLDHAGSAVDHPPVELVPRQRGPRPVPQLRHGDLERAVARVALQPDERRFVGRHVRAPWGWRLPRQPR